MKTPVATLAAVAAALWTLTGAAVAAEPCDIPGYLLIGNNELKHVAEAVQKEKKLTSADVILMNMQYSPRTEIMVSYGPYADDMRVVAQQHEIPLFDRLAIMRHWSDTGAFDLYAAGKDNVLAQRVHDCIGRGIASMIIDAAHLHPEKAAQ